MNRNQIPIPSGQRSGMLKKRTHKNIYTNQTRKSCYVCSTEFSPSAPADKYCSDSCAESLASSKYLWKAYGITVDDYRDIYEDQNGKCYICGSSGFRISTKISEPLLVVDHNHISGNVRGLLCHNCNRALGLLKDSADILAKCIHYVSKPEYVQNEKYRAPRLSTNNPKIDTFPKTRYRELVIDLFVNRLRIGECSDKYGVKPYVIKNIKEGKMYKIPIQKIKDDIKESSETIENPEMV